MLDVLQPDNSSNNLLKLSVDHWGASTTTPTDSQMITDGYVLQAESSQVSRPLTFTASGTGTAELRFTFTIQPKIGENRSDDIAVGIPTFTNQVCSI